MAVVFGTDGCVECEGEEEVGCEGEGERGDDFEVEEVVEEEAIRCACIANFFVRSSSAYGMWSVKRGQ